MTSDRMRFDDHVAIVTGAAGGLGRAHATLLASRGARVVVNDLPAAAPAAGGVVEEIRSSGGTAITCLADVSAEDGGETLVAAALAAFGRIDIVVNNAGAAVPSVFPVTPLADLMSHLGAHVAGSFSVTRAAWNELATSGHGRVVMTTSPAGLYGHATQVAYSAAKGALVGLARSLAIAGEPAGIAVNAIAPRASTGMLLRSSRGETYRTWAAKHLDAGLVAAVVAYLAHESCRLNGEIVACGGGRVARVVIGETQGIVDLSLTPEAVARVWDEAADAAVLDVASDVEANFAFMLRRLEAAGVPVDEVRRPR